MTAEVAIMNKSAIALAADSAVTGRDKIYNTVNKLFRLSDHRPVGVMVYGSAEFMGVPWETLIKMGREELATQPFNQLHDYVDWFIKFLRRQHPRFPQAERERYVRGLCREHLRTIRAMVQNALKRHANEPRDQVINDCVANDCVAKIKSRFQEIAGLPADARQQVRTGYGAIISDAISAMFRDIELPAGVPEMLTEHCIEAICRLHFIDPAGIVIAGFGEDEIFPALVELEFEGLALGDHIKWRKAHETAIDFSTAGLIVPFAQREMVDTFLTGAHPAYQTHLNSYLREALRGYSSEVLKILPGLTPVQHNDLQKKMRAAATEMIKQFNEGIADFAQSTHIDPILTAVEMLPKDELAAMAESMIKLDCA